MLVSAIHQHESAIGTHRDPLSLEPPSDIPPLYVVTGHQVELLVSYGRFPLAFYFTYDNVYFNVTFSFCPTVSFPYFRPTFLPPLCPQVQSIYLHHHLFPTNKLINTIFLDFICVCVCVCKCMTFVSLSDLLHSV